MAVWASVRFIAVDFEIREEKRPKRNSASIDQGRLKIFLENAIALFLDFDNLI
jgi:hypothetical protein